MTKTKGWFGLGNAPKWVGAAVIVIGLIAMTAGIGGGILQMLLELQENAKGPGLETAILPTGVIETLIEFMQALAAAPQWLALTILGIFLVGWGATML